MTSKLAGISERLSRVLPSKQLTDEQKKEALKRKIQAEISRQRQIKQNVKRIKLEAARRQISEVSLEPEAQQVSQQQPSYLEHLQKTSEQARQYYGL